MASNEESWVNDVRLMARRMAIMYHYFAEVLTENLGEEKAADLIKEVIWRYGRYCGEVVREEVLKQGLEPNEENFSSIPDLPSRGWEMQMASLITGENRLRVTFCPLAKVWKEMGTPLARLYCLVDQAKYAGYNPDLQCIHTKNVLDGDALCELAVIECKEKNNGKAERSANSTTP